MISHRAGRWGFNATYAGILIENGYRVDCSVTPYVSWAATGGENGCDYSRFPAEPYFLAVDRIDCAGDSPLLELPMTIRPRPRRGLGLLAAELGKRCGKRVLGRGARYLFPAVSWLRPDGRNLRSMLDLLRQVRRSGRRTRSSCCIRPN